MLAACRGEPVDRTPVWFMRQARRCLAGYRRLRERHGILEITRTPELCAQVTTMPVDTFGVDGAVLYADIMLPLYGMGVPFSIDPGVGPIVHRPVRDTAAVEALRVVEAEEATPELFETIRLLRRDLDGRAALIGFAGAPYTVASYLIEGRPSKEHARAKALLYGDLPLWHRLMETLTEVTVRYLRAQVAAGVQVVQLFDSWMGDLGRAEYEAAVLLAPFEVVVRQADRVLRAAGGRDGHIFNLGHGVLPDTPSDHLTRLVEHVHKTTERTAVASP
jgi:uroporphyrinogen decarboxylase